MAMNPAPAAPQRPVLRFPAIRPPSRGAWTFFSFFLFALALIGGAVAATWQPDLAISFRQIVADLIGKLPETVMIERVWQVAGGAAGILILVLIWQAGRYRRPIFWPILIFLCLATSAVGVFRGGKDLARMVALQEKLDQTTGSLQKSSLAIQERDAALSALKKELEELKQKLAEKP